MHLQSVFLLVVFLFFEQMSNEGRTEVRVHLTLTVCPQALGFVYDGKRAGGKEQTSISKCVKMMGCTTTREAAATGRGEAEPWGGRVRVRASVHALPITRCP